MFCFYLKSQSGAKGDNILNSNNVICTFLLYIQWGGQGDQQDQQTTIEKQQDQQTTMRLQ